MAGSGIDHLSLSWNSLGDEGAAAVAQAIPFIREALLLSILDAMCAELSIPVVITSGCTSEPGADLVAEYYPVGGPCPRAWALTWGLHVML